MKRILLIVFLLFFNANTAILYINGGYNSINYHLGVLRELERLKIPVDTIVGTDWGGFAGALWSAGWNAEQIGELLKSFEDSLQKPELVKNSALFQKKWIVANKEDGSVFFEEISEQKPYFGDVFFELKVKEALWRSDIGSKIPFKKVEDYPFPKLTIDNQERRILSTLTALRDTNGTSAEKYQQKLWKQDSSLIVIQPHLTIKDSLYKEGVSSVQRNRSKLAKIRNVELDSGFYNSPFSILHSQLNTPPRFLYIPVLDSVSPQVQGHLESFWNPKDTGILAVSNFLENVQNDGFYRDINLTLDTGSYLQINAQNSPQISGALNGFGGTLFGANARASANMRFVNQFGYNLNLSGFYGQGAKGFEPSLVFERFFMGNGDFFAKLKIYEYEPLEYFQRKIYYEGRIINESGRNISVGIEKGRVSVGVDFDSKDVISGAMETENTSASMMFPYFKWLWQSENYDRWFAKKGFMAEFLTGFKAISVNSFNDEEHFYMTSKGKLKITHELSKYVSVSAGSEFGANFRRAENGKLVFPEEIGAMKDDFFGFDLHNPALDNRYRFAMGMGMYNEAWNMPSNSSHLYSIVMAGICLQWQGSGIFLDGGFAKDAENNFWSEIEPNRFFVEPKIRVKTPVFDFILGRNIILGSENRLFFTIIG